MKLVREAAVEAKIINFWNKKGLFPPDMVDLLAEINDIPMVNISNVVLRDQVDDMVDDINKAIKEVVNNYLEDNIDD
jgi:tRNA A-37 threonylcarbamoyl transferase component Bud32